MAALLRQARIDGTAPLDLLFPNGPVPGPETRKGGTVSQAAGTHSQASRWKAKGRLAVRFAWLYYTNHCLKVRRTEKSRGGETGRLAALKTRCPRGRRGSKIGRAHV